MRLNRIRIELLCLLAKFENVILIRLPSAQSQDIYSNIHLFVEIIFLVNLRFSFSETIESPDSYLLRLSL